MFTKRGLEGPMPLASRSSMFVYYTDDPLSEVLAPGYFDPANPYENRNGKQGRRMNVNETDVILAFTRDTNGDVLADWLTVARANTEGVKVKLMASRPRSGTARE